MRLLTVLTMMLMSGSAAAQDAGVVNCFGTTGSMVYIDGEVAGVIPLSKPLTEGRHTFRVEQADGTTYELVRDIRFSGGAPLNLPLTPDSDAAEATTAPEPAASTAPAAPTAPASSASSTLVNLFGVTGSSVAIDGNRAGQIPFAIVLDSGEHTFTVTSPNGETFEKVVTVESSDGQPMSLPLSPP